MHRKWRRLLGGAEWMEEDTWSQNQPLAPHCSALTKHYSASLRVFQSPFAEAQVITLDSKLHSTASRTNLKLAGLAHRIKIAS